MQDWDHLVMILIGSGIAIQTGVAGWRSWRQREKGAAVGAFLLGVATVALPIMLALFGG